MKGARRGRGTNQERWRREWGSLDAAGCAEPGAARPRLLLWHGVEGGAVFLGTTNVRFSSILR